MTYRLLKVVCQAVLVSEDDNGDLTEHLCEPVSVRAADWPDFTERLIAQLAALNNGKVSTHEL